MNFRWFLVPSLLGVALISYGDERAEVRDHRPAPNSTNTPAPELDERAEVRDYGPARNLTNPPAPELGGKKIAVIKSMRLLSYDQWQAKCYEVHKMQLATINNEAQKHLVVAAMRRKKIRDLALTAIRRSSAHSSRWVNGDGYNLINSYRDWECGEPNDANDGESCVGIYPSTGTWNDMECYAYSAVCENPYHFFTDRLPTGGEVFGTWLHHCRRHGGRLATVNNANQKEMAKYIIQAARHGDGAFLAYRRDPTDPNLAFINMYGERLADKYNNWGPNQPNYKKMTCLVMEVAGIWQNGFCDVGGRAYLCEM